MGQFRGSRHWLISNLFSRCSSLSCVSLKREHLSDAKCGWCEMSKDWSVQSYLEMKNEVNKPWREMNSPLLPRALVVPQNPSWTAERQRKKLQRIISHAYQIAQAKGTACIQMHTVAPAHTSICNSQKWGKLTLRPGAPGSPASPFWPLAPCSPGSPSSPWGSWWRKLF